MSDNQDTEVRAREIGWRPQEEFKGDPEKWVDADTFLKRGEEVLPLVKAENRRLHERTDSLTREIQSLKAVVNEQRAAMDDIAKFNAAQLKDRLAQQRKEIMADLRKAREEEDDGRIEELEEQLEENRESTRELKTASEKAPEKKPASSDPTHVEIPPEQIAWQERNKWFGGSSAADKAKTAAAIQFGREVAAQGIKGQAFYNAVDAKMAEAFPQARRSDPTEDGRPSGGGGSSSSQDKGFKALPAEAQAKAREQVSRFVGPNKMFKDEKAWFSYYAEQYNATEA